MTVPLTIGRPHAYLEMKPLTLHFDSLQLSCSPVLTVSPCINLNLTNPWKFCDSQPDISLSFYSGAAPRIVTMEWVCITPGNPPTVGAGWVVKSNVVALQDYIFHSVRCRKAMRSVQSSEVLIICCVTAGLGNTIFDQAPGRLGLGSAAKRLRN